MSILDVKQTHEEKACQRFLSLYNLEKRKNINFIKLGNPDKKEPDCICSDNVAIELVGVYANKYQAEKIWNKVRGKNNKKKPNLLFLDFDNLQNEIGKKLQKLEAGNYNGFSGKLFLVLNLHSPLLEDKEVEKYIETYSPFRRDGHFRNYFFKIYISWKSADGNWKIKNLE